MCYRLRCDCSTLISPSRRSSPHPVDTGYHRGLPAYHQLFVLVRSFANRLSLSLLYRFPFHQLLCCLLWAKFHTNYGITTTTELPFCCGVDRQRVVYKTVDFFLLLFTGPFSSLPFFGIQRTKELLLTVPLHILVKHSLKHTYSTHRTGIAKPVCSVFGYHHRTAQLLTDTRTYERSVRYDLPFDRNICRGEAKYSRLAFRRPVFIGGRVA